MIKVLVDDTPLRTGHAIRGIGSYTRQLINGLHKLPDLEVVTGGWKDRDKSIDIVHFPYFDLFQPTLPSLRRPTVVTIHDVIPLEFPEQYPVGPRGTLSFWRQKRALKHVKAIVTDSAASKASIIDKLKIPYSKIAVVHLAADPELVSIADQAYIAQTLDASFIYKPYILYVGDINYNKNVPQLIKTLKFLPEEVSLVLVGKNFFPQDIPEWRAIETQVALSDVAHRVKYVTDIPIGDHKRLAALYAGASCYVQPSLAEGFGLPVLDALQVGTPVVASNRTSLPEVGGTAVHYSEPIAESFAQAIMDIMSLPASKRQELIIHGKQHAAQFTWQKVAEETAAVYRSVLDR